MTAIPICFSDYEKILDHLKQGKKFSQLFSQSHSKFFQSICILSEVLNLQECMDCIHAIENGQSGLKKKLLKQLIYPSFLIIFSYFLILFFTWSILPVMEAYISASLMQNVRLLFVLYSLLVWALLLATLILFFGHKVSFLQSFLARQTFQKQVTTYTFCTMYRILHEKGCTSMECIKIIGKMKNHSIQKVVKDMTNQLEQGISFLDCIQNSSALDPIFIRFATIGSHSNQVDKVLLAYEKNTLEKLEQKVKKVSSFFQLFSYAMVAILLFVFYQIMLVPMNILETF